MSTIASTGSVAPRSRRGFARTRKCSGGSSSGRARMKRSAPRSGRLRVPAAPCRWVCLRTKTSSCARRARSLGANLAAAEGAAAAGPAKAKSARTRSGGQCVAPPTRRPWPPGAPTGFDFSGSRRRSLASAPRAVPKDPRGALIDAGLSAYRAFATTNSPPLDFATRDPQALLNWLGPKFASLDVAARLDAPGWTLQGVRMVPGIRSAAAFIILENAERAESGSSPNLSTRPSPARRPAPSRRRRLRRVADRRRIWRRRHGPGPRPRRLADPPAWLVCHDAIARSSRRHEIGRNSAAG